MILRVDVTARAGRAFVSRDRAGSGRSGRVQPAHAMMMMMMRKQIDTIKAMACPFIERHLVHKQVSRAVMMKIGNLRMRECLAASGSG